MPALATYPAILRQDRLEWTDSAPDNLPADRGVPVYVTLLEPVGPEAHARQGAAMAELLGQLASRGTFANLGDAAAWQREQRQDRPLPGRDV